MSLIDHRSPLLRTWLFGPGADSAVHEAMSASGADVLIQDLEDSTPPPLRDKARALAASVARKKRSVYRDYMCTWLTALAVLRYAPDYGDFGAIMVMFPEWPKASG